MYVKVINFVFIIHYFNLLQVLEGLVRLTASRSTRLKYVFGKCRARFDQKNDYQNIRPFSRAVDIAG